MARQRTRARPKAAGSLYVVQRAAPEASQYSDEPKFYLRETGSPYGSSVPVGAFATKKAAETARKQLEREARESTPVGPFMASNLGERIDEVVAAAVAAAGLPPVDTSKVGPKVGPTRGRYGGLSYGDDYFNYVARAEAAVRGWWDAHAADLTPAQNAALWAALFPDHQFYTVVRVPLEE